MSDFYFGFYLECEGKTVAVINKRACSEHGSFDSSFKFCPQCGELLDEQTYPDTFSFFSSGDGTFEGSLSMKELEDLHRDYSCLVDDGFGTDFLVPYKTKVWGLDVDCNREMNPPKIPTLTETRAKLKNDIKFLKKFYSKVKVRFGVVDMW